ncbi:MAG: glycosyltransferase 87 family protein [Anaerolineaceae bacterium]
MNTIIKKINKLQDRFFFQNNYLKYIGFIVLVITILFIINLVITHSFIGGSDFYVKWSSANLLRTEQLNPYSSQNLQQITGKAEDTIFFSLPENYAFTSPIYSLFLYYPLSWINNFEVARAIWMTCLCIFLILALHRHDIFTAEIRINKIEVFLAIFILGNIFSMISLLSGDLIVISFTLVLFALKQFQKEKYELAGILCGLATFNPGLALTSMFILAIFSTQNRKSGFLIWFLITTGLLCFSGFLFQDNWMLQFLQSNIKFFRNLISELNLGVENPSHIIKFIFPLILLVIEWIRSLNRLDQPDKINWLFNFTLAMIALSFSTILPSLYLIFIPAWIQIFSEWEKRDNPNAKKIGFINLIIYIGLTIIMLILNPGVLVRQNQFPATLFWLTGIHLILNMYWIRGWLYRDTMRNYIKPE